MGGFVPQLAKLVGPCLHVRRQHASTSEIVDFLLQGVADRLAVSKRCLKGAPSHHGSRVPVLVLGASVGLNLKAPDGFGPVIGILL